MAEQNKPKARLADCKYCTIRYTDIDIFGHDSYQCFCGLKGNKEVSYLFCAEQCEKGLPKDEVTEENIINHTISDEEIMNIIDTVTEYMYCNWDQCCMKEKMTWDKLQKVRDEIKNNTMEMIKINLDMKR